METQTKRNLKTSSLRIGGMTCVSCRNRIERTLKNTLGVEDAAVNYNTGTATVTYNASVVTFNEIKAAVESLDYRVLDGNPGTPVSEIMGTGVIILALYMLLQSLGIGVLTSAFPTAEAGMGYGMLFVVGLITSLHCIAMCGGINLSQNLRGGNTLSVQTAAGSSAPPLTGFPVHREEPNRVPKPALGFLLPAIFYNGGRVISYTLTGTVVGALGSVITVSGRFQGVVQLAAGVFMVIMGINMLGLFPALRRFSPRLPNIFPKNMDRQKAASKSPLLVGLLNGLMPCGPLQAMQIYALSTGSPLSGGISMFLFSMGTVPLMFGIGALSSALSGAKGRAFSHQVMKAGAILVTVMGMTMVTYGFGLSGVSFDIVDRAIAAINPFALIGNETSATRPGTADETFAPVIENGVQLVNSTLSPGRYPAITVQQGIPVRWTISAPQGSINGCNNRMIIREYGIEHRFASGNNVIEFTPERAGRFSYSCWMGMIRSSITVLAEGESIADIKEPDLTPSPAGIQIPTDAVAVAALNDQGFQEVRINLTDNGFDPSVIVLQRYAPARWIITNDSLDPGNGTIVFPAYYTLVDMENGDNMIQLMPQGDFDFSTADNVFYGYVKVVEDLSAIDLDAIKQEVADFETLIYPQAYFDAVSQARGEGCCGGAGT